MGRVHVRWRLGFVRCFFIVVAADSRTYRVDKDKFLEWLSKDRDSSDRKKYLRRVLDGLAD